MTRPMPDPEIAAHQYADAGWPVFPCQPGGKLPLLPSAHPGTDPQRGRCTGECGREGHGFHDAVTGHQQISQWWARQPDANVAIRTGAPGPDVLDIDRHGDQSGFPALRQLQQAGLVGQPLAVIRTPSNGGHLYFKGTEHQRNGHIEAAHVDFRSGGGYVVAPPSQVGGRPYVVLNHQASTDSLDWNQAKNLLNPRPERTGWQPQATGQPGSLDHLVRYVAECDHHVNDRLFWAACRMIEAGQEHRLAELAEAAYAAGEDRRGQPERTISSALRTARPLERDPRPFQREAG